MNLVTRGLGDQRRGWLVARGLGGLLARVLAPVCRVRWGGVSAVIRRRL